MSVEEFIYEAERAAKEYRAERVWQAVLALKSRGYLADDEDGLMAAAEKLVNEWESWKKEA